MSLSTLTPPALAPTAEATATAMIARQAIVDAQGHVAAYELFSRYRHTSDLTTANDVSLIFAALAYAGIEDPSSSKPILVKCSHESIASGQLELVAPARVVLEIEPLGLVSTSEVMARVPALQSLRERGFKLAFGHMVLESGYAAWLPLADYIKLDMAILRADQLTVLVSYAERHTTAKLMATRVENSAQHERLLNLGVRLFQGYSFSRPALVDGKMLAPTHTSIIQLINLLRQNAHPDIIEEALKKDVALAFNLMRLINSAGLGLSREITTFRQAMLILGTKKMFRWAALLLTASKFGNLPASVGQTAVVRGRLMELLALDMLGEDEADQAFVTGAFSLLDVMLEIPLHSALKLVHVPPNVEVALLHREGVLGELLELAQACEGMRTQPHDHLTTLFGLSDKQINTAHLQALAWTDNLCT